MDFVLRDIGELTTNERGIVADGALAVSDGTIMWVGTDDAIPPAFRSLPVVGVGGRAVLPGFVDAHTHCVFAGDRSGEFARRMRGERYEDILDAGGGIRSTVEETRSASQEELVASARARLNRMLRQGTTTVEIKSGYGLDTATELKMLEVIAKLGETHPIDVVPTFLGAHVVPVEYWDDRAGYIRLIIEEMLPACAPYARYCDVFCDEGAFTVAEAREVLEAGLRFGLKPRMHVEQLAATGGVELAAELGAVSADHLDHVTPASMAALRSAGTVAVLL
ncbi:MAG: imidazolonepropionase, partial [Acidimicrobiia bacterium]